MHGLLWCGGLRQRTTWKHTPALAPCVGGFCVGGFTALPASWNESGARNWRCGRERLPSDVAGHHLSRMRRQKGQRPISHLLMACLKRVGTAKQPPESPLPFSIPCAHPASQQQSVRQDPRSTVPMWGEYRLGGWRLRPTQIRRKGLIPSAREQHPHGVGGSLAPAGGGGGGDGEIGWE